MARDAFSSNRKTYLSWEVQQIIIIIVIEKSGEYFFKKSVDRATKGRSEITRAISWIRCTTQGQITC